jgi:NAD(P) transhydrogenase subunit alpha
MNVGIPKETQDGERRVGGTPDTVAALIEMGFSVVVESGAGVAARFDDTAYEAVGASIAPDADALWASSDIITKINPPNDAEVGRLGAGKLLVSLLQPGINTELVAKIKSSGGDALALDKIPRITRAQKMDVLSSQANIAGYRAVIEASAEFGGFFGGQITAAGKTKPAQVLVIGAGVAGLAAIGAARSLGAQVRAFDTRKSVEEQIQSMGATFLEVELTEDGETAAGYSKTMSPEFIAAEMALFKKHASEVDIVITTALIPGRRAPILWKKEALDEMKPGSVVVDLAAPAGGNCEATEPGTVAVYNNVKIVGYTDLTSRLAPSASQFFGKNICHLLEDMGKGDAFQIDLGDEVVRGAMVVHGGEVIWPPPKVEAPPPPPPEEQVTETELAPVEDPADEQAAATSTGKPAEPAALWRPILGVGLALLFLGLAVSNPPQDGHPNAFVQHFTVFVLACFVGWQVVWNVAAALHTPLMSVTNAISWIIVVGGILQVAAGPSAAGGSSHTAALVLGVLAILFASINIAGGFLVTQRMLKMFRR